jgi:hypothetical protein
MAVAMRDSDPSGEPADYKWPADELARFNAYMSSTEPLWEPSADASSQRQAA